MAAGEGLLVGAGKGGQKQVKPGAWSSLQTAAGHTTIWHSQPSSDSGKTASPTGQTTSGHADGSTAWAARTSG